LTGHKTLRPVSGTLDRGRSGFTGYEMHVGVTDGPATARPFAHIDDQPHGAISTDGRVAGCYVHGLFANGGAREALLRALGGRSTGVDHRARTEAALDEIASVLAGSLDIDALARIAGL
jgi:adenosylcobyric acid synthase